MKNSYNSENGTNFFKRCIPKRGGWREGRKLVKLVVGFYCLQGEGRRDASTSFRKLSLNSWAKVVYILTAYYVSVYALPQFGQQTNGINLVSQRYSFTDGTMLRIIFTRALFVYGPDI